MPRLRRFARARVLRFEALESRSLLAAGIGVYAPANESFVLRNEASAGEADAEFQFPAPGALPVVGDWNGDGRDDFGVFESPLNRATT